MDILGITFGIDSAAALVRDGRPLAAVTDERFTRTKHSDDFPVQSIQYCLQAASRSLQEIDAVAFFWNPGIHLESFNSRRSSHYRHHMEFLAALPNQLLRLIGGKWQDPKVEYVEQSLKMADCPRPLRMFYITHHVAHAASTFYPSPFDEAAILTLDGYGERACGLMAAGRGQDIQAVQELRFPHSLGSFYAAITQYLGFKANQEEGTVMALAAYGDPSYCEKFKDIVQLRPNGRIEIDQSFFSYTMERPRRYSAKFTDRFGPERATDEPIDQRHKDIAAGAQRMLSEAILHMARYLHEETGLKNLCMAGGVALNSVANGLITRDTPFERVFVQPAAGDNGASLGAALYVHHTLMGKDGRHPMVNDFLGPEYSDDEIGGMLAETNVVCQQPESIERTVAELLAAGKLVGWFQGRMEFGPRALGGRSILAHPGLPEIKDDLNRRAKHREPFRPFAPSVLAENCGEFFDPPDPAPFMLRVSQVRPDKADLIPAVTHADGSARLHTVDAETNPRFYRLIEQFRELTGLPMVLNTSFNVKGEPIVCTPQDALRCFFSTGLDHLALGSYLISK